MPRQARPNHTYVCPSNFGIDSHQAHVKKCQNKFRELPLGNQLATDGSSGSVSIPSQAVSRLGLALPFVGSLDPGGDGTPHPFTADPPSRERDGSPDPMGSSLIAERMCSAILPRSKEGQVGSMLKRIVNRMVERAMPPYIDDPDHERIARDAAETAIRQTARVAGVTGLIIYLILFVVIAAILYVYFPPEQISRGPSEATKPAHQARAEENTKLRQSVEDLQSKLDGVTKELDTLQGKLAALEGQGAELDRKLQAARVLPAPKNAPQSTKQATTPARTPVLESRPSTYQCGDGRTVRDPTECEPENATALGLFPRAPSTYLCGDGRTVRDPAECEPAAPGR